MLIREPRNKAQFRTPKTAQENPQKAPPKVPQPYTGNASISGGASTGVSGPPAAGGGDYDSPWEWKVNKVEREFEKRFSVNEKPVAAPRKKTNTNPNANPIEKPARVNPPATESGDTPLNSGYQVDPTIPLENQG